MTCGMNIVEPLNETMWLHLTTLFIDGHMAKNINGKKSKST